MSDLPSRTLGVAFSDGDRVSRVAGAILRSDDALDGLAYEACTVGGSDATDAIVDLVAESGREDVRHLCLAGVAPAWFNLVDLCRLHEELDRPVSAVSYEASPGLEPALRGAFDGEDLAERLAVYRSLPPRRRVPLDDSGSVGPKSGSAAPLFVRAIGLADDRAAAIVRSLVREGFRRPEPLRIASIAASAHREAIPDDSLPP
ncbi:MULTISPECIES: DUF99 family protein [Haloferacaceae]|uniref:UPF0215 protein ACFPJA_01660 n=1 Tax=Halorubrum glutamatedens TaxID=2707018 RepID=A0ABD5QMD3_9EURY|nr:DUF99 family protein [Halobellus captivus]